MEVIIPQAWHCAILQSYAGFAAATQIASQGYEVFNPTCLVKRIVRHKPVEVERPYLPGYLFIRFDALEDNWKKDVHYCRGVKEVIRATPERPTPISQKAMDILLERCDAEGYIQATAVDLELEKLIPLGSLVRINEGPLIGRQGIWSAAEKIGVLLSVFGRDMIVPMKTSHVELIGGSGQG